MATSQERPGPADPEAEERFDVELNAAAIDFEVVDESLVTRI